MNHEEWSNKIENGHHLYTSDLAALEKTGLKFDISMPVTYIWSVKTCAISPSRDILCRDMITFYQTLIDWLYMGEDARLMDPAAIPDILVIPQYLYQCDCFTNGISIEFEIRPKFVVLWFKIYSTITTKLCTHHDYLTVVTCAKYRCDRSNIFPIRALHFFSSNFEFNRNTISRMGARYMPVVTRVVA